MRRSSQNAGFVSPRRLRVQRPSQPASEGLVSPPVLATLPEIKRVADELPQSLDRREVAGDNEPQPVFSAAPSIDETSAQAAAGYPQAAESKVGAAGAVEHHVKNTPSDFKNTPSDTSSAKRAAGRKSHRGQSQPNRMAATREVGDDHAGPDWPTDHRFDRHDFPADDESTIDTLDDVQAAVDDESRGAVSLARNGLSGSKTTHDWLVKLSAAVIVIILLLLTWKSLTAPAEPSVTADPQWLELPSHRVAAQGEPAPLASNMFPAPASASDELELPGPAFISPQSIPANDFGQQANQGDASWEELSPLQDVEVPANADASGTKDPATGALPPLSNDVQQQVTPPSATAELATSRVATPDLATPNLAVDYPSTGLPDLGETTPTVARLIDGTTSDKSSLPVARGDRDAFPIREQPFPTIEQDDSLARATRSGDSKTPTVRLSGTIGKFAR